MNCTWLPLAAVALLAHGVRPGAVSAQVDGRFGVSEVVIGNMILGGATASIRALIERKDPRRAFVVGSVGGAVYLSGKLVASRQTTPIGLFGVAIGAVGSSIVSNAGRGIGPLAELYVPLGPLRLRYARDNGHRIRVSLNAYESVLALHTLARDDVGLDWSRSLAHGTFVFVTRDRFIRVDGDTVNGLTSGTVVIVSGFVPDIDRTIVHESVHVQQNNYMDETWGRPIELALRKRLRPVRLLPAWIDVGLLAPTMRAIDAGLSAGQRGPLGRLQESEAEWFERR